MTTDISVKESSELQSFEPREALQNMAAAEVAEKYYTQAKDLDGLRRAIETIWTARHDFVVWWDAQEKDKGGDSSLYAHDRPVKGVASLADFNLSPKTVSRWRQKASSDENLADFIESQYSKVAALINADYRVNQNAGEHEWYTPANIIEAARLCMGSIDCDPASSAIANETVKAEEYFTKEQDGLEQTWSGNVWLNPPYAQPAIQLFCNAAVSKYLSGEISTACILVNNGTETAWGQAILNVAGSVCFPSGRIRFLDIDGKPGAPLQGQMIVCLGRLKGKFTEAFQEFGCVF